MTEPLVRVRATVRGRVQGVGFRAFACSVGSQLGVRGRVANLGDGSVECVAEGPRPAVDELLRRLRTGPSLARVEDLDVVEEPGGSPLPPMDTAGWAAGMRV